MDVLDPALAPPPLSLKKAKRITFMPPLNLQEDQYTSH
jgi:hypothetical protein